MGAMLPCFNERKGSVEFFHECTWPVTDCELRFEDEMLLRWLITKLNLNYQRLDFTFINQHYSQIVALLKTW